MAPADILLIGSVWYGSGLVGSALVLEFGYRRGSCPLDIDVRTLVFGAVMALAGAINLGVSIAFVVEWAVTALLRKMGGSDVFDRVVFRRVERRQ